MSATRTLLRGGQVFDGTGADPAPADIVIADGQIVEVGVGLDGDVDVDLTGRTVLPGLFDCHVHVTASGVDELKALHAPFSYQFYAAERNLRATLATGITTARDLGGADAGIREAIADGTITGPRLLIAVNLIGQTGGHTDGWMRSGFDVPHAIPHPGRPAGIADGPDEMRRVVRQMLRAGADVIKVCSTGGVLSPTDNPRHAQFTRAELEVAVAEAATVGTCVASHAQGPTGIKNALLAGVRSIEHGIFLDDEAIQLMLDSGAWLVPTLIAPVAVAEAAQAGARISETVLAKARDVAGAHQESFRRAVEAGVRVAMGTDSGVGPHGQNLRELELMAAGGMAPQAVLHAATGSAAQLCGLGDVTGRVSPGLAADLVVVEGDPFQFADLGKRIEAIWLGGQQVRLPDE